MQVSPWNQRLAELHRRAMRAPIGRRARTSSSDSFTERTPQLKRKRVAGQRGHVGLPLPGVLRLGGGHARLGEEALMRSRSA